MSRSIPHRERRNSSSKVLREVQSGETIEVTNNGEVVAVLVPPGRSPMAALRTRVPVVYRGFSELPGCNARTSRRRPWMSSVVSVDRLHRDVGRGELAD